MRIKLIIEYRGTAYSGWQRQENAISIQETIEKALQKITGDNLILHASGRTDKGVHALGQTAHFDYDGKIPADKFTYLLNDILPPDISIISGEEVADSFHARFSAVQKTYLYKIYVAKSRRGSLWDTHKFVFRPLNIALMNQSACSLTGTHDFKAFCSSGSKPNTTIRTLFDVSFTCTGNCEFSDSNPDILTKGELHVRFTANGFLYNMVRIIMSQLLCVGTGLQPPEKPKQILNSLERKNARGIAPPEGLYLEKVEY